MELLSISFEELKPITDRTLIRSEEGPKDLAAPLLCAFSSVGVYRFQIVDVDFKLVHHFLMLLSEIVELHLDVGQRVRHPLRKSICMYTCVVF